MTVMALTAEINTGVSLYTDEYSLLHIFGTRIYVYIYEHFIYNYIVHYVMCLYIFLYKYTS